MFLSIVKPKILNNRTNSSHVKSLGCFLNRFVNLSFALIQMDFWAKVNILYVNTKKKLQKLTQETKANAHTTA